MGVQQAAARLQAARQITVLTGAGVSKESGIPTFRDALDGLWAQYDPTQLATPQAFLINPKLVWEFYEYRRRLMTPAQPNPGHMALAALQRRYPSLRVITQNVDDLHERAGSSDVIRLHGSIALNRCFYDCQGYPTRIDVSLLAWDPANGTPLCPHCGRWVRPDVVWFGEVLPSEELDRAVNLLQRTDVMLVVGTSGLVTPAADMPWIAGRSGAFIIEVNPDLTPISEIADLILRGPSGEVLPRIVEAIDAS
ncbi:MAG: NAD-dependent deacylase [Anaerolineae bacterium]|nr:NAD-dependent deacylase [Anaerolineae bacterium]